MKVLSVWLWPKDRSFWPPWNDTRRKCSGGIWISIKYLSHLSHQQKKNKSVIGKCIFSLTEQFCFTMLAGRRFHHFRPSCPDTSGLLLQQSELLMMCDSNSLSPREAYKAELEHFLDVAQGEAHLQVICCVHIKMWWWLCWWCWWCWRWWSCTRWQGRWCWQWQRSVRKQHSQAKVDKRW